MPKPAKLNLSKANAQEMDAEIAHLAQAEAAMRSSDTPQPAAAERSDRAPTVVVVNRGPVAAGVLTGVCVLITLFNLGVLSRGSAAPIGPPPNASQDLAALMDVEVSLLESYKDDYGGYPSDPAMAGVETEQGDFYLRVSPEHFKLTLERDGVSLTADSSTLTQERDDDEEEDFS